ncbi:sensor histidine kinase [Paenibacillus marinisediminis]
MSDRNIKRLILWTPTITIGLWEYIRHAFLLPYISMDMGNFLAPVIVFLVSLIMHKKLFALLDEVQRKLGREQRNKAALEERERLAQELHDGIAQSLFLLSVKIDRLEASSGDDYAQQLERLRQTVRHVHDDVRQAITSLHHHPDEASFSWASALHQMIADIKQEAEWEPDVNWQLDDEWLMMKEKITLFSCIREALTNIRKHAQASEVKLYARRTEEGFLCEIRDNGVGFTDDPFSIKGKFGLKMMRDRVRHMGWSMVIIRQEQETVVQICKGELPHETLSNLDCG